jgi:Mg2+ and Co2+ transporter CorA
MPAYLGAMLQQTADNLDRIQQLLVRSEENRGEMQNAVGTLSQRLAALSDRLTRDQDLFERLLGGQQEMLRQMAQRADSLTLDPATREHIRNTDVQLGRLIDEMGRGRNELSRELRSEIKLVARTIAIVAGEPEVVRD